MRESLLTRIASIEPLLGELYLAALIAADVDAHELNVRTLASDTTVVLAYSFKCYSQRAARNFWIMLLMNSEDYDFANRSVAKYARVNDDSFSATSVRIPLVKLPSAHQSSTYARRLPLLSPLTTSPSRSRRASKRNSRVRLAPVRRTSSLLRRLNTPRGLPKRPTQLSRRVSNLSRRPSRSAQTRLLRTAPPRYPQTNSRQLPTLSLARAIAPDKPYPQTPRLQTQVQPAAAAGHVLSPRAQSASPTVLPQADEQVFPHARLSSPNTSSRMLDLSPLSGAAVRTLKRPAPLGIPSHSAAQSITLSTRRRTSSKTGTPRMRPSQLRLRLSSLRVLRCSIN